MIRHRRLLPGFATCLAYLAAGELGLMIAIPPSYATLLWMPAGIALGMTLLYGRPALVGVFAGACLVHIGIGLRLALPWQDIVQVPLLVGLGASLQAKAGAWLVKRWIGQPLALHRPRLVAQFLLLTGPVACTVNALIGPLAMWLDGRLDTAQLPTVMVTWWIGDSLGVIMMLPLMLVLFRHLRESWMPSIRHLAIPLALICAGSLLAFQQLSQNEQRHQQERFRQYAAMQQHSLQDSLDKAVVALSALQGFVQTSPQVTPGNFRIFTNELLRRHPELHGLSWNPRVPRSEREAFERRMTALYGTPFRIREVGDGPADGADPVVVGFIEPLDQNRQALGLDVRSDSARAAALAEAAASGQPVPTEPIQLVQESARQAGVLIFLPVYDGEPRTGAARQAQLRGYATAILRVGDLARQSIGHSIPREAAAMLIDPAAPPELRLLYRSGGDLDEQQLADALRDDSLPILERADIRLGNRAWELLQYAETPYIEKPQTLYYLLTGVFLLSGLYSWLVLVLAGQRNLVQQQVAERTRELALSSSMLAEANRIAGLSQWTWRPELRQHRWSESFYRLLGLDDGLAASVDAFLTRVQPACRAGVGASLEEWLAGTVSREPLVCELLPASGQTRHIELQSDWISDERGRPEYLSIVARDISERWRAEEQIRRLAYYDSLTGLPNRDLLHENLRQQIAQGRRSGLYGVLLFIDLDNFKSLNDTLGHSVGDELLRNVTTRLREGLREQDIISRFGGDEFLILLPCTCAGDTEAAAMGAEVAQKVIDLLQPAFQFGSYRHSVSASVGLTLVPQEAARPETLVMQADTAMYHAKASGKGCFAHYRPDMQAELVHQVQLEQELRQALQQGQLELHYQPQFDARRRLVGAEALLRWRHPQQGLLLPACFIGVAEETGLINPIGEWVLDRAIRQLAAWLEAGRELPLLAVNISPGQLADAEFVNRLDARLAGTGVEPQRLCLEFTEQVLLPQASPVHRRLEALRKRGYAISIDDFGTGYSSLNYLKKLPFNELKIAREFVRDLPDGHRDAVLVKTILSMARTLGVNAIAEGVETVEQFEYLCQLGCPRFQGYYLARPMEAAELERLLVTDYAVEADVEIIIEGP